MKHIGILKSKRSLTEQEWITAFNNSWKIVPFEHIQKIEASAIALVQKYISMYGANNLAYAWSGGKDSILISEICRKAGITQGMFGTCDLEYPEFQKWVNENIPSGVEPVSSGRDLEWLLERQDKIFPSDTKVRAWWFQNTHRVSQKKYYREKNLSGIFLGRRRIDGNTGSGNDYRDKSGALWITPVFEWTHEELFAYLHYYKLELPPIYNWKNGFLQGTHLWPMRGTINPTSRTADRIRVWEEIYSIDKGLVIKMSKHFSEIKYINTGE